MPFADVYQGRRVLVTGHTGFKGSWLSLWLKLLGAEVAGYSLDVPTRPANFDLLGLKQHLCHFSGDIRDRGRLAQVIDEFKPQMVFHLAAQALVHRSYSDPITTFEVNTLGMANVLEIIRKRHEIQAVVLITSDKAYRNNEWTWGYRETDALGGHDPYSGSKSCAEMVAHSYFQSFFRHGPTRLATTRAGNVIGGGDFAPDRIVPDCIRAWSQNEPVLVRSPNATRPWQHVLEPLSGYLWLGAQLLQTLKCNGEAYNFGPDASVNQTVGELLNAMSVRWQGAKWISPQAEKHETKQEATLLKLSCDKALAHLNWRASLQFSETVAFTADWYCNWHDGSRDLYEYSVEQIKNYQQLARNRELAWAM